MVKEGWKEVKLDVLYEFRSGLSKGKKFFGSGYPFLTYKEIFNNYFVPQKLNNLAQTSEKERINCSIKRGDVFLTRTSETVEEIGTSCVALKDYPNATFNGFAKRLRPKNNEIYPEYAVCYFRSEKFRNKAASMCSLITRASLNNDDLSHLTISYPKYDIQKKNATILLNYDLLTINIFNRIKILEKIAKLIYDEWFVKFKFPGHEKVKMVDSELGKIPEGWGVKKIDEIIKHRIKINKKIKRSEYLEQGDIPCVDQSRNFIAGYTNDKGAVFDEFLPVVVFGDHTRIVKFVNFPFACGADGTQLIFPENENISPEFLYFLLINIALSNFHYARHFKFLKGKKIIIPKEDIMETFNEIIKPIMMLIPLFRDKTINLHKTRDLLLPKLISGQVDVSDLDIKVPEMQEIVV